MRTDSTNDRGQMYSPGQLTDLAVLLGLVALGSAVSWADAAPPANPLANPGFEELDGALPRHWGPVEGQTAPVIDREHTHEGEVGLRFAGDGAARSVRQRLTDLASRPFTVAGWVRAQDVVIGAGDHAYLYVHVIYRDKPYDSATHAYHRLQPGTYDWRRVKMRVDPIATLKIREVLVTCTARFGAGIIWFDDLQVLESALSFEIERAREHVQWLLDSLVAAGNEGAEVAAARERASQAALLLDALAAEAADGPVADGEGRLKQVRELGEGALSLLDEGAAAAFWRAASDSPTTEVRAIYHGGGRTQAEVNASLDRLEAIGANTLYPSLGSWNGVTYRSDLAPTLPQWRGSEGLRLLVGEARRRNVTVIPYLAIFNAVTPEAETGERVPGGFLAQRHPDDPQRQRVFPAPSHAEVREHVVGMAVELFGGYDLDGLGLDYIRYPDAQALCVCDRCRDEIQGRFGFDVRDGNPWADADKREALQAWRAEHITETVKAIAAAVREVKPSVILMAHCLKEPDGARQHYGQDWSAFAEFLDLVTTMNYGAAGGDAGLVGKQAAALQGKCRFVPAIGGMPGQHAACGPRDWLERISLARRYGVGVAIYAINYLQPEIVALLSNGPFREPATWPQASQPRERPEAGE